MSDWIHCNRCNILLKEAKSSGLTFYLTNCGHILCARCRAAISSNNCPICQATCNTVELNSRIGPDIQLFFSEPVQMLKKHHRAELQVVEFQNQHIKRLLSRLQQERAHFDTETKRLQEENRKLSHELGMFRAENNRLRSQGRTPEPPSFPHTPPTKQSTVTPKNVTPTQGFYTPLARSPSPMGTPVRTPAGPGRYSLKSGGYSQVPGSSQGPSPTSPGVSHKIPFPSSSQRGQLATPILTPGITNLLQSQPQSNNHRAPNLRNPLMSQNAGKNQDKWSRQEYSQPVHMRNPLQITPTRRINPN